MDLATIVNLIKDLVCNVGFPIACVCVMFRQNEKMREAHENESAKWTEAFNRNTEVLSHNTDVLNQAISKLGD